MCGLFIESLLRIFPIQWKGRGPKRAENAHVARTKEVVFLRSSDANEIIIGLRGSINILEKKFKKLRFSNCKVLFETFTKLILMKVWNSFRGVLRIVDFIVLVLPCDHILRSSILLSLRRKFFAPVWDTFDVLIRETFGFFGVEESNGSRNSTKGRATYVSTHKSNFYESTTRSMAREMKIRGDAEASIPTRAYKVFRKNRLKRESRCLLEEWNFISS